MKTPTSLIVLLVAFAAISGLHVLLPYIRKSEIVDGSITAPAFSVPALSRALRPKYPYSVIAGGAYSPAELRFVYERDALVREHFADFNLSAARLVTLTADRDQYVSFRLANRIYWTRNKLRIPQGEILLTDGRNYARTRCGNRLSSTPMANTTVQQPSERLLSLPPFRSELLASDEVQLAPAAPKGELEQKFPLIPFEAPALAPSLPPLAQNMGEVRASLSDMERDSPIVQTGLEYITAADPSSSEVLGWPVWPPTFLFSPPSVVSDVSEPASLYLFGLGLCVSSWCLMRMMLAGKKSQEEPMREETEVSATAEFQKSAI